jgi:opacity protein-like surface antigen
MRRLLAGKSALAVLCLTGVAPAFCEDLVRREVFGAIGIGKTYDDEGSLGSGLNAGGGFGYRLSQRFALEAEVNGFRTRRDFSSSFAPFQANGAHVMGSGLLYLSRGRAQAYLLLGAGLLHVHVKNGFGELPAGQSGNGFAVNLGGGLKIFMRPHFSLRPELRIYSGGAGGAVEPPFSDIRISLGVGYHW